MNTVTSDIKRTCMIAERADDAAGIQDTSTLRVCPLLEFDRLRAYP